MAMTTDYGVYSCVRARTEQLPAGKLSRECSVHTHSQLYPVSCGHVGLCDAYSRHLRGGGGGGEKGKSCAPARYEHNNNYS